MEKAGPEIEICQGHAGRCGTYSGQRTEFEEERPVAFGGNRRNHIHEENEGIGPDINRDAGEERRDSN